MHSNGRACNWQWTLIQSNSVAASTAAFADAGAAIPVGVGGDREASYLPRLGIGDTRLCRPHARGGVWFR
jgi:hypothetical protein